MAEEEIVAPPLSWLGDEPLDTKSSFALGGTGEITFSSISRIEDWEVVLPRTSDRV